VEQLEPLPVRHQRDGHPEHRSPLPQLVSESPARLLVSHDVDAD
jgi:hypothetical protein